MKLSVVIITYNEGRNIGNCIDSVRSIADEIVVLDSLSSDDTVKIAREKGANVYLQPFLGYIEQKNEALNLASHPYVLCLDADEVLDETLRTSIREIKKQDAPAAYTMNRCTSYCGKFIRHGSWYPDKKLRLFDRSLGRWGGENPHDRVILRSALPVYHLKGDILHYSYDNIGEHVVQNSRFSTISAESMFEKGRRTSLARVIFNPWWAFTVSYFIRLGILDGFYGFVIAVNIAHLTFLKHAKLYQKQRQKEAL